MLRHCRGNGKCLTQSTGLCHTLNNTMIHSPPPPPPPSYILDRQGPKGSLCLLKQWSTIPEPYAYQTTITDIAIHAPEYKDKGVTLEELFPPKSQCFIMAPPHYGSLAEVRLSTGYSVVPPSLPSSLPFLSRTYPSIHPSFHLSLPPSHFYPGTISGHDPTPRTCKGQSSTRARHGEGNGQSSSHTPLPPILRRIRSAGASATAALTDHREHTSGERLQGQVCHDMQCHVKR